MAGGGNNPDSDTRSFERAGVEQYLVASLCLLRGLSTLKTEDSLYLSFSRERSYEREYRSPAATCELSCGAKDLGFTICDLEVRLSAQNRPGALSALSVSGVCG